jgi:hypothetical protein
MANGGTKCQLMADLVGKVKLAKAENPCWPRRKTYASSNFWRGGLAEFLGVAAVHQSFVMLTYPLIMQKSPKTTSHDGLLLAKYGTYVQGVPITRMYS